MRYRNVGDRAGGKGNEVDHTRKSSVLVNPLQNVLLFEPLFFYNNISMFWIFTRYHNRPSPDALLSPVCRRDRLTMFPPS